MDEIDNLVSALKTNGAASSEAQAKMSGEAAESTRNTQGELVASCYPDHFALGHAIAYARDAGDIASYAMLENLKERSSAFGQDGFGTHIPALTSALVRLAALREGTPAPILELGAGHYSTHVLHEFARSQGVRLETFDADREWLARLSVLRSEFHRFTHVPTYANDAWIRAIEATGVKAWSLAFIDHREKVKHVRWLASRAKIIVVHDTLNSFHAGLDEELDNFDYRLDYATLCPCTSIVSNFVAL